MFLGLRREWVADPPWQVTYFILHALEYPCVRPAMSPFGETVTHDLPVQVSANALGSLLELGLVFGLHVCVVILLLSSLFGRQVDASVRCSPLSMILLGARLLGGALGYTETRLLPAYVAPSNELLSVP